LVYDRFRLIEPVAKLNTEQAKIQALPWCVDAAARPRLTSVPEPIAAAAIVENGMNQSGAYEFKARQLRCD
jgi:hypothetical protein